MNGVKLTKRPKGYTDESRFGILNPYGDIWTSETFSSEDAAQRHIAKFWRNIRDAGDLTRFKVIPVRVRVSALTKTEGGE